MDINPCDNPQSWLSAHGFDMRLLTGNVVRGAPCCCDSSSFFPSLSLSLFLVSHCIFLTAGLSAGFCCNPCLIRSTKRMRALFLLSLPVWSCCLVPPRLWWHLWIITQLPSLLGIITCWHNSEGGCQISVHLNLDHLCCVLDHHKHYYSELTISTGDVYRGHTAQKDTQKE